MSSYLHHINLKIIPWKTINAHNSKYTSNAHTNLVSNAYHISIRDVLNKLVACHECI